MTDKKDNPDDIKVVRVGAYPISCSLLKGEGQPPILCQIVHIEEHGFIFKSHGVFFKVGDEYIAHFELPALHFQVHEPVKVMKTYESIEAYMPNSPKEKVMTVEVHFKVRTGEFKTHILLFLKKLGKKKA